MASPWMSTAESSARALVEQAHNIAIGDRSVATGVRRLVHESWQRSLQLELDPDQPLDSRQLTDHDLREYRDSHPLSLALPAIHRLLIRHTLDAGLIVAIGDQDGRLLWIDGDRTLRRRAEGMLFVEGADWSEKAVGTSAPGTALALDHGIQIHGAEHFNRIVHPWSCTAVPVHDPSTGAMLGVIDITGGDEAVAPATLPLMEAAVAAVESELRIQTLDAERARPRRTIHRAVVRPEALPALSVLGLEGGSLEISGTVIELSVRHAEIMVLLAWHASGLSAERLGELLGCSVDTVRPEMVRLRRVLERADPSLVPTSRPYKLARALDLDVHRVLAFLDRGAHRVALAGYSGQVLPSSVAPGVRAIRDEVCSRVRESMLTDASLDTLLAYARSDEAAYDVEVWTACLTRLPAKSPKRASIVSRLERINAELA
ncbi:transcriptional regulator [Salinibacterium sp. NK8237]|uniref:transcriptional regulator n=1 Tax=Salinibacterium sp. NK8237 TaxID=2792038 RepID=UPI0018CEB5E0|nr:transcriptional regulator [Salinibacterium sp. NK8237]MBH0129175.1 transcriptional regulator [Salinibacterium sp. NK8237]